MRGSHFTQSLVSSSVVQNSTRLNKAPNTIINLPAFTGLLEVIPLRSTGYFHFQPLQYNFSVKLTDSLVSEMIITDVRCLVTSFLRFFLKTVQWGKIITCNFRLSKTRGKYHFHIVCDNKSIGREIFPYVISLISFHYPNRNDNCENII